MPAAREGDIKPSLVLTQVDDKPPHLPHDACHISHTKEAQLSCQLSFTGGSLVTVVAFATLRQPPPPTPLSPSLSLSLFLCSVLFLCPIARLFKCALRDFCVTFFLILFLCRSSTKALATCQQRHSHSHSHFLPLSLILANVLSSLSCCYFLFYFDEHNLCKSCSKDARLVALLNGA